MVNHSEDVLVMYENSSRTGAKFTHRSFRLWERYIAEYVATHQ